MKEWIDKLNLSQILDYSFLNNTVLDYLIALGVLTVTYIVVKIIIHVLLKKLTDLSKKTENSIDDTLINFIKELPKYFYWTLYIYIPLKFLTLGSQVDKIIDGIFVLVVLLQVIKISLRLVRDGLKFLIIDKNWGEEWKTTFNLLYLLVKIWVWVLWGLIFLTNIWVEVTPLIASLWVWGIAVAFALQNILEDVFSSFSIYFDKPFTIGDFIQVGSDYGTVKKIGIKTSRLQTLQWEELVISNKELTSARINNFWVMESRRIVFTIGVVYGTPVEKLKKIKEIISDIISSKEKAELDRVHFKSYGDWSLNYEIVYYVQTSDYYEYMDLQEAINLEIYEQFEKEGIEFAYPTRTIINKGE